MTCCSIDLRPASILSLPGDPSLGPAPSFTDLLVFSFLLCVFFLGRGWTIPTLLTLYSVSVLSFPPYPPTTSLAFCHGSRTELYKGPMRLMRSCLRLFLSCWRSVCAVATSVFLPVFSPLLALSYSMLYVSFIFSICFLLISMSFFLSRLLTRRGWPQHGGCSARGIMAERGWTVQEMGVFCSCVFSRWSGNQLIVFCLLNHY